MPPKASKPGEGRPALNTKKVPSSSSSSPGEAKKLTPRKKTAPSESHRKRSNSPRGARAGKSGASEPEASFKQQQQQQQQESPAAGAGEAVEGASEAASSSSPVAKEPSESKSPSKAGGGAGRKGKKGEPPKKEEKNKLDLSSAALRSMADALDAVAQGHLDTCGSLNTIASKCGEVLEKKMNGGMKTKEFFDTMDKNGDVRRPAPPAAPLRPRPRLLRLPYLQRLHGSRRLPSPCRLLCPVRALAPLLRCPRALSPSRPLRPLGLWVPAHPYPPSLSPAPPSPPVRAQGKVSKMEFRQAMRDLGLMGEGTGYNKNDVDALFSELDADSGGDLDLSELTAALKGLRLRAQSVLQQEIVAKEKAEYWKDRAERTREAAAKVEEWERATVELHEVRTNPSPESKLGALILKRGLKPADILTALLPESDSKKRQSDIDEETFSTGIIGLGVECTREELGAIFQRLDADGGGTLDYEELKEAIKDLSEAKNVALAHWWWRRRWRWRWWRW